VGRAEQVSKTALRHVSLADIRAHRIGDSRFLYGKRESKDGDLSNMRIFVSMPARERRLRRSAWVAGLISAIAPTSAIAQVSERELAARRALIDQASVARNANQHERALDLAERAGRIQMTPSLRMFIAESHVALRNHVEAIGFAERCVQEADRDASASNRPQIIAACRRIATTSREQVGFITIVVSGASNAAIVVSGQTLNEALVGVPYMVNAGDVRVEVSAPGFVAFERRVPVAAGATVALPVALERLPATTTGSDLRTAGLGTRVDTTTTTARSSGGQRGNAPTPPRNTSPRVSAGAIVVTSTGAASLAASLGFFLARNAALDGCVVSADVIRCTTEAQRQRALSANDWAIASGVAFGVGLAAVAGGALWLGLAMTQRSSERRAMVAPTILHLQHDRVAVGVIGRF
jgi:hypothetical protein